MKKIKLLATTAAIAAITCTSAMAFESRLYGGAEIGSSKLDDNTKSGTQVLVSEFGGTATATQDSTVQNTRFFGGYKLNPNIDLELGYINTSSFGINFSGRSGGNVSYSGSISEKVSGFDYSALIRPSIESGYNNAFFRIGMHNYKTETSGTISAGGRSASFASSDSGSGTLFGIGYDGSLDKDVDFRLSVTRLNKISGETDASATVYTLGVLKRF